MFAGLPGSGKSAVADEVARRLRVPVLSVDPIEEGMDMAGIDASFERGLAAYLVAERVAAHLLSLGQDVMVDACNAEPEGRAVWRELAGRHGLEPMWIEVRPRDPALHRRRLEGRSRRFPGAPEPTWDEVQARRPGLDAWQEDRLVLDPAAPTTDLADRVLAFLADRRRP